MLKQFAGVSLGLVLLLIVSGCGGSKSVAGRPATVPTKILVTYKGSPVEGAMVTLIPNESKGKGASGLTDASGQCKPTTFEPGDGAVAGSYKVIVSKTVSDERPLSKEEYDSYFKRGKAPPPPKTEEKLPVKYKNPAISGLTATISASGPNEIKLDLND